MSQSEDWEALARYLAGESSTEEVEALEARFAAEPADKALLDSLATITDRMKATLPTDLDVDAALELVRARRKDPVIRSFELTRNAAAERRRARWVVSIPGIAAVALLAIGIAGYLTLYRPNNVQQAALSSTKMTATGIGAFDSLRLVDGTRVILGPLSSIRITKGYGVARRDVEVRGDAYLEVVHDSSRPFIVHANKAIIEDLGTRFSVRADSAQSVVVSVADGSVALQGVNTGRASGVILKQGDRGIVRPDGRATRERATLDDMAWLRRQLVFRETPLREVTASLHRWYGIELSIPDASLAERHLTATFSGEPPERVLEMIRLVLGAEIERHGDTAIVRARK